MKKTSITLFIALSGLFCTAQKAATLQNDTLSYDGKQYFKGQSLQIGYGSGNNNEFTFVKAINTSFNFINCPADMAKTTGTVTRVYIEKGTAKISLKIDKATYPLSILVEGAVDKKEIL